MDMVTIYWILFLVGLAFATLSAIFTGFGEAAGGHDFDFSLDHDMDLGGGVDTVDIPGHTDMDMGGGDFYHGHGEIALSPVSPVTIAAFVGGFGGGGLIGVELGWEIWVTTFLAVPCGLLLAGGVYWLMYIINKGNISSEARSSDAIGTSAEIITPIVEDGTGEIAYVLRGSRYNSPARSLDGKSISRGRAVKIWRLVGTTAYVKEILPEEADGPDIDPSDARIERNKSEE